MVWLRANGVVVVRTTAVRKWRRIRPHVLTVQALSVVSFALHAKARVQHRETHEADDTVAENSYEQTIDL